MATRPEDDWYKIFFSLLCRLGHGDLIEEEGKSTPFRVELLHIQKYVIIMIFLGNNEPYSLFHAGRGQT